MGHPLYILCIFSKKKHNFFGGTKKILGYESRKPKNILGGEDQKKDSGKSTVFLVFIQSLHHFFHFDFADKTPQIQLCIS